MADRRPKTENLYLDQVTLQDQDFTLRLFIENKELELETRDNRNWTPIKRPALSPTSELRASFRIRTGKFLWAKNRQMRGVINLHAIFNDYWRSNENEVTVPVNFTLDGRYHQYHRLLELRFSANTTTEALRSLLHELEPLVIGQFFPLMSPSLEKVVERTLKFGSIFATLNPIAKAVFIFARYTFELLQEENQIPSLLDRLMRLSPLADIVAETIDRDETSYLGRVTSHMFEVIYRVARVSCDYVKYSRMEGGLAYLMAMRGMDGELTKAIEEFVRAVGLEALRFAKRGHRDLRARTATPQNPNNILEFLEGLR